MVVLIVLFTAGFGQIYKMYRAHLEFKHRTQKENTHTTEQVEAMQQELTALKQRIETLETIVTDEGFSVKQEINRL